MKLSRTFAQKLAPDTAQAHDEDRQIRMITLYDPGGPSPDNPSLTVLLVQYGIALTGPLGLRARALSRPPADGHYGAAECRCCLN